METIMQSIRIAVLALALCFGASLLPVQSHAAAPLPKVKIETSMGDIVVELNPAKNGWSMRSGWWCW